MVFADFLAVFIIALVIILKLFLNNVAGNVNILKLGRGMISLKLHKKITRL